VPLVSAAGGAPEGPQAVHHVLRKQHLAGSQQEGSGGCNCNFAIHMINFGGEVLVQITAAAATTTTSAAVSDRCHSSPTVSGTNSGNRFGDCSKLLLVVLLS